MAVDFIQPRTLDEALSFLREKGKRAVILGGGSDVVVRLKDRIIAPDYLLDLSKIDELRYIEKDGNFVKIGSTVTIGELLESETVKKYLPVLHEAAKVFGSPQIRNIATIGGNIGNSSPVADTMPALYVHSALLSLRKSDSKREIEVEKFQTGPGKNILEPGELITEIRVPIASEKERGFFFKLGQRRALIIAKVSVAALFQLDGKRIERVRIALGAVAPRVIRAPQTEEFLRGKELSEDVMREAARICASESKPITDLRSTESYRRYMVGSLLYKGMRGLL